MNRYKAQIILQILVAGVLTAALVAQDAKPVPAASSAATPIEMPSIETDEKEKSPDKPDNPNEEQNLYSATNEKPVEPTVESTPTVEQNEISPISIVQSSETNSTIAEESPSEPPSEPEPVVNPVEETAIPTTVISADSPKKNTKKTEPEIITEQTIYIPYDNLRQTFEKNGRGVFLPYDQFRELWDAAQSAKEKPKTAQAVAPIAFMLTESHNEATVSDEIIQVESKLRIDLLKSGWHEIPLRLSDTAITKATINGEPARILGETGQGYRLLIENPAKESDPQTEDGKPIVEPVSIDLVLHFAKAINKSPGRNSVAFEVPQAPISRWKVVIPESGVKVDFFPLIAASEKDATKATKDENETSDSRTEVYAFTGSSPTVRIGWTPKTEGATGLEALTTLQMEEQVIVDEGVVRTEAKLDYTISRSQIERLAIEVPSDQKVIEVFDPNVRQWSVNQGENAQTISVELFEPAKTKQSLVVKFEQFTTAEQNTETVSGDAAKIPPQKSVIKIPTIIALGVGRQQGILVVRGSDSLSIDAEKTSGLMQVDASELPQNIRGIKWDFAYRLASSGYGLELAVEKVQPRISAVSCNVFAIDQNETQHNLWIVFTIERAGVFQLFCDIPEGYTPRIVEGFSDNPAAVDSYNLVNLNNAPENADAKKLLGGYANQLVINLSRKAIGKVGVHINMTKSHTDPALLASTGNTVDFNVVPPMPSNSTGNAPVLERREGKLIVSTVEAFRMTPKTTDAMQSTPLDRIQSEWLGNTSVFTPGSLGYVYGNEPAKLELGVQRRKPQITIQQTQSIRIDDGVVKNVARFRYTILYCGVKTLRVDVPALIAEKIRCTTPAIRDTKMTPQPDDVEKDYVALEFSSDGELFGNGKFDLNWETEMKQLQIGIPSPVSVERLTPRNADRAYGHLIISKGASIDLNESASPQGLQPVDPKTDIQPMDVDLTHDAAAAFEYFDSWKLELTAVRYKTEELKKNSIEQGILQLVSVRASDNLTARAMYKIRSVKQRLPISLVKTAEVSDVSINGKTVGLESDDSVSENEKRYLIPLNSVTPDTPFLLEIRYSYPGSVTNIEIPGFPEEQISESQTADAKTDTAAAKSANTSIVQWMNIAVYVPDDYAAVGFTGPWTPDFSYKFSHEKAAIELKRNPNDLISGMVSNVGISGVNTGNFPTAGSVYVFTALQPGNTPEDALKVYTIWERGFHAAVSCGVILLGLAISPFGWIGRIRFMFLISAAILIAGIFHPTAISLALAMPSVWYGACMVFAIWIGLSVVHGIKTSCKIMKTVTHQASSNPTMAEDGTVNQNSVEKFVENSSEPETASVQDVVASSEDAADAERVDAAENANDNNNEQGRN